jgi:hypothetical protein
LTRVLLALAALAITAPAYAQQTVPERGTFGIGAFISANPSTPNVTLMTSGFNGSYWVVDNFKIAGNFGLASTDGVGTQFSLLLGGNYYPVKNRKEQYGVFVGADLGVIATSPSGGNSTTSVLLRAKGGGEYYISRHFSAQLAEMAQFSSDPTTFAFITEMGLNWYF